MFATTKEVDYHEFVSTRISNLRVQKNVSARDMSLSLGQSESYINKIENKKAMPSMAGFLYICEYFGITPQEFFNDESHSPQVAKEILKEFEKLTPKQASHILDLIKDLNEK